MDNISKRGPKGLGDERKAPPFTRLSPNLTPEEARRPEFLSEVWYTQGKTNGTGPDTVRYLLQHFGDAAAGNGMGIQPSENGSERANKFKVLAGIFQEATLAPNGKPEEVLAAMIDGYWEMFKDDQTLDAFLRHGQRRGQQASRPAQPSHVHQG